VNNEIFQIVVPVFNEEKVINDVLENAQLYGYLEYLVVVNDASTDRTKDILDKWGCEYGLYVIHLSKNAKKEGAILEVLESLERNRKLKPYTVVLDADTRLQLLENVVKVIEQILCAINYLEEQALGAIALRINASYFNKPTPSYLSAYSTFFGLQFDCWLFGLAGQLWVINGAAGLFRSDQLLGILRGIVPSFETGDLQITVDLMKMGERVRLYDNIKALTYVPESALDLFNQRRRWERGTIKVMWSNREFYLRQFFRRSFLGPAIVLHFMLYFGLILTGLGFLFKDYIGFDLIQIFLISSLIWFIVDILKGAWVSVRTEPRRFPLFCFAAIVNVPVWIFIVIPARLYGGTEALHHLFKEYRESKLAMSRKKK